MQNQRILCESVSVNLSILLIFFCRDRIDMFTTERMMRLLVANGFAEEPSPLEYLPTALSKEMTQRTSIGVVESMYAIIRCH